MSYQEADLRNFGRIIGNLAAGKGLSREEARECYRQVILNEQPELQQGAFLIAHLAKGPATTELAGAWDALYEYDTAKIEPDFPEDCCDIVGTGSDALKTVNVSTPAAMVSAACGVRMAKKGARLVTGVSGATDVLELMGLTIEAPLDAAKRCLEDHSICYLPGEAFLKAGWGRLIQSMRFTSAFNIIGPLTKPCAKTSSIVIGAYAEALLPQLIEVLRETGTKAAMAPYGMSDRHEKHLGIDEISICGPTRIVELHEGKTEQYTLTPADFGVKQCDYQEIASRESARGNALAILKVMIGKDDGPLADLFAMNAAATLRVSGKERDLKKGVVMAREAIANGKALEKLRFLIEYQGSDDGLGKLERLIAEV